MSNVNVFKDWDLSKVEKDVRKIQSGEKFVVVDIETTGFEPNEGAEIIEIAAVKIEKNQKLQKFESYVKPNFPIPDKITELTGITEDDVKDANDIEIVINEFKEFIGDDSIIVAHNAFFDWERFLVTVLRVNNLKADNDFVCTYKLFHDSLPGLGKGAYTNEALGKLFGFELIDAHSATQDVALTAKNFIEIYKYLSTVDIDEIVKEANALAEQAAPTPVEILSVNYWEKEISSITTLRRHYIKIKNENGVGNVLYDHTKEKWMNKDFKDPLNFLTVEKELLKYAGVSQLSDLLNEAA